MAVPLKTAALLLCCTLGIYAAYLTQGIVSEHLQMKRYGPEQERFHHLEALNGAQALVCFVWAYLLLVLNRLRTGKPRRGAADKDALPPWHVYWKPALTNSLGPAFGMIALKNISYPAQVLAKSCKMVPVMIMGTLLHRKHYSALEYGCMMLIGGGVALFARRSSSKVTTQLEAPNAPLGYFLCLLNLTLDGYTNAYQDDINHRFHTNSPIHMMAWMNFWGALFYGAYMSVSGVAVEMLTFCARHTDAARDVGLFCLCGALGQLVIFFTIKTFGALVNTLICTTRKFFNILGSVLWNGYPLLSTQWFAVALVFSGLLTSTVAKQRKAAVAAGAHLGGKKGE